MSLPVDGAGSGNCLTVLPAKILLICFPWEGIITPSWSPLWDIFDQSQMIFQNWIWKSIVSVSTEVVGALMRSLRQVIDRSVLTVSNPHYVRPKSGIASLGIDQRYRHRPWRSNIRMTDTDPWFPRSAYWWSICDSIHLALMSGQKIKGLVQTGR